MIIMVKMRDIHELILHLASKMTIERTAADTILPYIVSIGLKILPLTLIISWNESLPSRNHLLLLHIEHGLIFIIIIILRLFIKNFC